MSRAYRLAIFVPAVIAILNVVLALSASAAATPCLPLGCIE
jgi:hypothetical protein